MHAWAILANVKMNNSFTNCRIETLDPSLQVFTNRDLTSPVVSHVSQRIVIQLGSVSEFERREWIEAKLPDGATGYVLGPSARRHAIIENVRSAEPGLAMAPAINTAVTSVTKPPKIGWVERRVQGLWPAIVDIETSRSASRQGIYIALLFAITTAIASLLHVFGLDTWGLVDAGLFGFVGYGIYKNLRVAAVAGLCLYVLERGFMWSQFGIGQGNPIVAGFFTLAFINAVRGTFAYNRFMRSAHPGSCVEASVDALKGCN